MLKTITINEVELVVDYSIFECDTSCYGKELDVRIHAVYLEGSEVMELLHEWVLDRITTEILNKGEI